VAGPRWFPWILGLVFLHACDDASSPTIPAGVPRTREERWQQDIGVLARQLPARHPDLFFRLPQSLFEDEVRVLRQSIPSLSDTDIVVRMMRLVALVGDAHTTLDGLRSGGFRRIPLRFEVFADGVYVTGASEAYQEAVGARLSRVGDVPTVAVLDALREVISHDNEAWLRFRFPSFLVVPEVLTALVILPEASPVPLELAAVDGRTLRIEVPAEPVTGTEIAEAATGTAPLPLYRRRPEDNYWSHFLEDSQLLYVQYRRASNMPGESVAAFSDRTLRFLDENPVRAVVLDLRNNTGGNSSLLEPLIRGLETRPQWSAGEGLYVVIGKATFSSGLLNAVSLHHRARAILVGEPTGGKPNHFGEVRSFRLPNSALRVDYSSRFFRIIENADPPSLAPEILIETTSLDFFANRDPMLERVLDFVGR